MANLPVLVKPASSLSTTTLISALWNEPNWDAQVEIARQLETRDDAFNLNPLFEFLLDGNQKRMVQRAVARCTAKLGLAQALKQMEQRVLDPAVGDAQKLLALRALPIWRVPTRPCRCWHASPLYAAFQWQRARMPSSVWVKVAACKRCPCCCTA